MRKIGKLKIPEVKAFQKRRGITVDGIPGNQTMGEVLALEELVDDQKTEITELKDENEELRSEADEWENKFHSVPNGWKVQFPIGLIVGGVVTAMFIWRAF